MLEDTIQENIQIKTKLGENKNISEDSTWTGRINGYLATTCFGIHLLKFTWFDIERHVLIPGKSSPDDPNPKIQKWFKSKRKRKSKDYKKSWQKIARNQNYVCPTCRESLFNGEELHVHHIIPKSKGGKDTYKNLQLVHLMCHQQIHYGKPA